jgi:pyruvate formate lyase activating enzyme
VSVTGLVFDIQRFCIHDGPGIRTTVFLKGCPLECQWCHNPESQSPETELFYTPVLCIGCAGCVAVCPKGGHRVIDGVHTVDRTDCILCLGCAEACPTGAVEGVGRQVTVAEVMDEVVRDRVFYEQSGGGLTLSGGEPLAQPEFSAGLIEAAKEGGIHTCLETCGFGGRERVLGLARRSDLLLWDLKDSDKERHRAMTGVPLEPILDNLKAVDAAGCPTVLRCILLEGVNLGDAHLRGIADTYGQLSHCRGVELLAYHALGRSKLDRLGRPVPEGQAPSDPWVPTDERMAWARAQLEKLGVEVVSG